MHERLRSELVEAYEVLTVRENDSQGGPPFFFFCLERLAGVSLEDDARDGVHVATNVQALFLCTRRVHLWGDESIAGALALLLLLRPCSVGRIVSPARAVISLVVTSL